MRKRMVVTVVAAITFALSAAPAFAFECYNASRSAQGNAAAAGSNGFFTFEFALANFEGLCPAGVEYVIDGLQELGYDTSVLINAHALMAGGLERNGKGEALLHDGKGIDHLSEGFFEDLGPLVGAASAICGG